MLFAVMNIGTLIFLGSRTAFFSLAIIAVVYLMLILKTSVLKKSILFIVLFALFFGVYSLGNQFENFERLSLSSFENDQGSGRFYTWGVLVDDVIPNHLVKGIGVGSSNYECIKITSTDADNLYIDLLTATGIVGLILFLSYHVSTLVILFRRREKKKRDWDFLITIFLAFLVVGFGESVYDTVLYWYIGYLAMLAINDFTYSDDIIAKKQNLISSYTS